MNQHVQPLELDPAPQPPQNPAIAREESSAAPHGPKRTMFLGTDGLYEVTGHFSTPCVQAHPENV